jgi:hypothetical protein
VGNTARKAAARRENCIDRIGDVLCDRLVGMDVAIKTTHSWVGVFEGELGEGPALGHTCDRQWFAGGSLRGGPYSGRGWPEDLATDLADAILLNTGRFPLLAWEAGTLRYRAGVKGVLCPVDALVQEARGSGVEAAAWAFEVPEEAVRQACALRGVETP